MKLNSVLSTNGEQRWVDQISKHFHDEGGIDIMDVPISVFTVPKSISYFKPEDYVPQAIAFGPYHHFQTHLYQMERYKVAAVKALLNPYQVLSFESLVINSMREKELMIRACYHKYMNLEGDSLAWIFAIDGLFLVYILRHYSEVAHLIPEKLINNGVLYRDVMLLENQIPFVVLKEIRKCLFLSSTDHDHNGDPELFSMLRRFCEVHSPLKLESNFDHSVETSYLHLLDLMYHLIVNKKSTTHASWEVQLPDEEDVDVGNIVKEDNLTDNLGEVILEVGLRLPVGEKENNPIKVIKNIPWEKISNLLGLRKGKEDEQQEGDQPHFMETEIPSVSSLSRYGKINFIHTKGGIKDIKFEESKAMLYLPVITLDVYTKVLLRNLIAYEVATSNSTMELTQYVALMSGIVNTEADVKLLKVKGIIKGNMNDKEIADLFNELNECNSCVSSNKTLEQLVEYYNNRPAINAWRFTKKYLHYSHKALTIVLTIFVCLLMILYSFCNVYNCSRLLHRE